MTGGSQPEQSVFCIEARCNHHFQGSALLCTMCHLAAGGGSAAIKDFVSKFQAAMESEIIAQCSADGNACLSATARITSMKPASKRRSLLATEVDLKKWFIRLRQCVHTVPLPRDTVFCLLQLPILPCLRQSDEPRGFMCSM